MKFKTNIKCGGCIATVTPNLNKTVGENNWQVDLNSPEKTLTVADQADEKKIVDALKEVGYSAERI
ncbi:heavy metal transport/detoxification protein [Pedobacter sp. HMF7647]|uniref:Heavy metal transport/detoxification protein n=1 Tax=Hufsiella arboris TaxID=2695275 RepID=A0A7K1Y9R6_9SPHI|nr:heavy-metal-associated domain-containing protein [Hufsiella arboris]MXV51325.1 heavy metal transport/detoxification protein [Hufsiella arboris]